MGVQLLFTSNYGLAPKLIRWFTWSRWSHVDLITDNVYIIGARPFAGVTVLRLDKAIAIAKYAEVVSYPCLPSEADDWDQNVRSQLGRGYDYSALIGFLSRSDKFDQSDRWFCSELQVWAANKAGVQLFRDRPANRVTPDMLYQIGTEFDRIK